MRAIRSWFPAQVANSIFFLLIFCLVLGAAIPAQGQNNLLKRKITLTVTDAPIENVLLAISDEASFTFSYNASILSSDLPLSLNLRNEQVKTALEKVLPEDVAFTVNGNHLILLKKLQAKDEGKGEKITFSGLVYHAHTKVPLPNVVVYEVSSLISSVTNEKGFYTVTILATYEKPAISFGRKDFFENVVFAIPGKKLDVPLVPVQKLDFKEIKSILPTSEPAFSAFTLVPEKVEVTSSGQNIRWKLMLQKIETGGLVQSAKKIPQLLKSESDSAFVTEKVFEKEANWVRKTLHDMFFPVFGKARRDSLIEQSGIYKGSVEIDNSDTFFAVENLKIVRKLVPEQSLIRSSNIDFVRENIFQVSFLPPLGTNLKMSGLIKNYTSLNILGGYSYGVSGFEVAGLYNVTRRDVVGAQVAGLTNIVGGNVKGAQAAGLYNRSQGILEGVQVAGLNNDLHNDLKGVQIAGISNRVKGDVVGAQIAGLINYAPDSVTGFQVAGLANWGAEAAKSGQIAGLVNQAEQQEGAQIAGLVNYVNQSVSGFQLAGLLNYGRNVDAVQFSGLINSCRDTLNGAQISGFINYAKIAKGVQIGIINIADSSTAVPIGLLTFVKNGYRALEVYTTETSLANIAFKTGVNKFYNIFSAGYGSHSGGERWMFGYGVGSEIPLNRSFSLALEYTGNWVSETEELQEDLSLLNILNLSVVYRSKKGFGVSAGPSLNLWLTEWKDPETGVFLSELAPHTLSEDELGSVLSQVWVGGKVAVHF